MADLQNPNDPRRADDTGSDVDTAIQSDQTLVTPAPEIQADLTGVSFAEAQRTPYEVGYKERRALGGLLDRAEHKNLCNLDGGDAVDCQYGAAAIKRSRYGIELTVTVQDGLICYLFDRSGEEYYCSRLGPSEDFITPTGKEVAASLLLVTQNIAS